MTRSMGGAGNDDNRWAAQKMTELSAVPVMMILPVV